MINTADSLWVPLQLGSKQICAGSGGANPICINVPYLESRSEVVCNNTKEPCQNGNDVHENCALFSLSNTAIAIRDWCRWNPFGAGALAMVLLSTAIVFETYPVLPNAWLRLMVTFLVASVGIFHTSMLHSVNYSAVATHNSWYRAHQAGQFLYNASCDLVNRAMGIAVKVPHEVFYNARCSMSSDGSAKEE